MNSTEGEASACEHHRSAFEPSRPLSSFWSTDETEPGVHASFGSLGDSALLSQASPAIEDADRDRRLGRIASTFARRPAGQILEGADRHVVHNESEYLTDYLGDRATDYIQRNAAAGKPYFLYLAFNAVHAPHMVTAKYYDRFPQIQDHQLRVYAAMVAALAKETTDPKWPTRKPVTYIVCGTPFTLPI